MPYMCSCPAGTSFSAITPVPVALVDVDQLADARDLGVEQIVAEQDRERLVADRLARAQHRVAEPARLPLAHGDVAGHLGRPAHAREIVRLAACSSSALELARAIEVILDRATCRAR